MRDWSRGEIQFYSVPDRYLGLMLPVRITEAEVIIDGPHVAETARYPRWPREVAIRDGAGSGRRPPP